MKKSIRKLLSILLAIIVIGGSVISANARGVIVIEPDGCSANRGTSCTQETCIGNLCELLSRCVFRTCQDTATQLQALICQIEYCSGNYNGGQPCPIPSLPSEEPTQPAAIVQPTVAPTTVPSERPAPRPTDAPAPTEAVIIIPTEPVTEAPTQQETAAPTEEEAEERGYALNSYEVDVVDRINKIRRSYGLGELSIDVELSRVARLKSQDMHDRHYFDHTSPTYGTPFEMMSTFGIRYRTAGENIAMGYRTPQSVVDGWMNSPGHRANILNASFSKIGMGYLADGSYWTQMFIG